MTRFVFGILGIVMGLTLIESGWNFIRQRDVWIGVCEMTLGGVLVAALFWEVLWGD